MTDEVAMIRAVCEDPDSDTPRLVYADWLDDRGDEELKDAEVAELIRVQCELPRHLMCKARSRENNCVELGLPPRRWCRRCVLITREEQLIESAGFHVVNRGCRDAVGPFPTGMVIGSDRIISRGFVEAWRMRGDLWSAYAHRVTWEPGQRLRCGSCYDGNDLFVEGRECRTCGGVGSFPRECELTAQPLKRVILTTRVPLCLNSSTGAVTVQSTVDSGRRHTGLIWPDDPVEFNYTFHPTAAVSLLEAEWLGIRFTYEDQQT